MASLYTRRVFVLATAAAVGALRTRYGQDIDAVGGANTFVAPLSASGQAPATHFAASTQLTEAQFTKLSTAVAGRTGVTMWEYDLDANPGFPYTQAAALGLQWITS